MAPEQKVFTQPPGYTPAAILPEGDTGPRRFVVVITEIGERIVHEQTWTIWKDPDTGKETGGRYTFARREEVKKEVFRGEFTERPKISALATLMERTD